MSIKRSNYCARILLSRSFSLFLYFCTVSGSIFFSFQCMVEFVARVENSLAQILCSNFELFRQWNVELRNNTKKKNG